MSIEEHIEAAIEQCRQQRNSIQVVGRPLFDADDMLLARLARCEELLQQARLSLSADDKTPPGGIDLGSIHN